MKTYTAEELNEILRKHVAWLKGEEGGERANLRDANLRGANLRGANLRGANLSDANLSDANLSDANLSDAKLSSANLSDANLRYANLRGANLRGANLSDANLRGANLSDANLRYANGNGREVVSYTSQWSVVMRSGMIRIGCQEHNPRDWLNFDNEKISAMDSKALEWCKVNKSIVLGMYEAHFGKIEEVGNE